MPARDITKAFLLLLTAAILACCCSLPLIWDGSYQFTLTLIQQEPYAYLTRFHTRVLWAPLVWLSAHTDNLTAQLLAFGLPFLAAPAASVALSWWIVRRHAPHLAVWALFGVAAALPGQAFVINDSIWQQTILWPVLLGTFVPLDWKKRALLLVLAAFQFSHQIGTLFLAIAAMAAWIVSRRVPAMRREARGNAAVLGVLTLLAVAKTVWVSVPAWSGRFHDSYAAQQATLFEAAANFVLGVCHLPLAGMLCLWIVAWRVLRIDGPLETRTWRLVAIAGALWIVWALIPWLWSSAVFYRRYVLPMAFPFFCFALLDAIRTHGGGSPPVDRGRLAVRLATIFTVVLGIQSATWALRVHDLRTEAAALGTPVVRKTDLPCLSRAPLDRWGITAAFLAVQSQPPARMPLDHWGITSAFMALQGRQPAQYLAYDDESLRQITAAPHYVPLCKEHPLQAQPGPAGYYDHRPLLRRLKGTDAN